MNDFAKDEAAERARIKQILAELLPEVLGAMSLSGFSEALMTESQVEEHWGAASGYCAELRARGDGPEFIRLSPRCLRYRPNAVVAYERSNTFASNAAELVL
jgi:hypothetical protein